MKILLHIGQSKTGTSAIQAYLTLNRLALQTHRVLYPSVRINGMPLDMGNHNALADALMGVPRFPFLPVDEYFSQFFKEAGRIQATRMILSAEHFFGGEPRVWNVSDEETYFNLYRKKVSVLADYLHGHEVELIVYLRPQRSWLASGIAQTIRTERLIGEKPIYHDDRQFFEMAKPLLRYDRLLNIWRDVLNPAVMEVVAYDRNKLYWGSSVSDFLRRAGLEQYDLPCADASLQVNLSLTREYLEVKKLFNRKTRGKTSERVAIRCLEQLSAKSNASSEYTLREDVSRDLDAFCAVENDNLAEHYKVDLSPLSKLVNDGPLLPLSREVIENAYSAFQKCYHSPRAYLMRFDYAIRSFLRKRVKPLHSLLHQIKQAYRRRVYG